MKTTLGCIRRADEDFHMIQPGDLIGVGVSGGKDSLLLLRALALYRYCLLYTSSSATHCRNAVLYKRMEGVLTMAR